MSALDDYRKRQQQQQQLGAAPVTADARGVQQCADALAHVRQQYQALCGTVVDASRLIDAQPTPVKAALMADHRDACELIGALITALSPLAKWNVD